MSVETDIAEIKKDIKYMKEVFADKCIAMDEHVKESVQVRIDVHDNNKFRGGITKAMWVVYSALVVIGTKVFFFK